METLQKIRIVGNTYLCQPSIEKLMIKKTYKHGGGILGGCLKQGDRVFITDARTDIDTLSFGTDITLNRLSENFFLNEEYLIKIFPVS